MTQAERLRLIFAHQDKVDRLAWLARKQEYELGQVRKRLEDAQSELRMVILRGANKTKRTRRV